MARRPIEHDPESGKRFSEKIMLTQNKSDESEFIAVETDSSGHDIG
jgi:hypothetical protein